RKPHRTPQPPPPHPPPSPWAEAEEAATASPATPPPSASARAPAPPTPPTASSSASTGAEPSSSPSGAALPDHVRRAILELGLPDDGYNYLAHIREIRPSYSSTGGGGSSAVFLPTRRAARCGLPLSVKAYDARG
uniref:Uncharacterized protein n=1 Tax=Aegilops tauschii subsp. strangulata TaxID=200361 RepID=A0A453AZQ0_AEGTS